MLAEQRNDPDFVEGSGSSLSELKKKALAKKEQASAKLQAAKARRKTQSQETEQAQEDNQLPATVEEWVKQMKLEVCLNALKDLGCDDMDMLVEGDDEDITDIIAAVEAAEEIKKLSVKKFKRELAKLRGKNETF